VTFIKQVIVMATWLTWH